MLKGRAALCDGCSHSSQSRETSQRRNKVGQRTVYLLDECRAASAIEVSRQGTVMKFRPFSCAPVIVLALATSACQMPSYPRVAAAGNPATASAVEGVVHTSQICAEEGGGFGKSGRHFGDSTGFSDNPFNGCWPQ
jgi:hypothetical protein